MKKFLKTSSYLTSLRFFALIFASQLMLMTNALAAEIKIISSQSEIKVGDTAELVLMLDTQNQKINVIEGEIAIKDRSKLIEWKEFGVANSALSFWPNKPAISLDKKKVFFTGGAPGGASGSNLKVLSLFFTAKSTGKIELDPANIKIYLNDGQGNLAQVSANPLVIEVLPSDQAPKDAWQEKIESDKIAPEKIIATPGLDPAVADGQRFIYISAQDAESGIDRFEVEEEGFGPISSGNIYVLRGKAQNPKIKITAFDKAGNAGTVAYVFSLEKEKFDFSSFKKYWPIVILILGLLILISYFLKKKKQK